MKKIALFFVLFNLNAKDKELQYLGEYLGRNYK